MQKGLQRFGIKRMKYAWLVGISALTIVAAGCGGGSTSATGKTSSTATSGAAASSSTGSTGATSKASAPAKTYRMIVANETCHDTQETDFKLFMTTVEKLSNGQIQGSFHSCSSIAGSIREVLTGLQNNSIQVGGDPTVFLTAFIPQAGVINMPWMFPANKPWGQLIQAESNVLEKGQFRQELAKLAAAKGFHLVSLYGLSPELLFSRKPIKSVADLKGLKMNVGAGKEHSLMAKEWGALPVTVPIAQWYTSLQQGTMDVQESPPDVALKLKIPEVAPYVTVINEAMMSTVLLVSQKWYDSLPSNLQKVIDQAGAQQDQIGTTNLVKAETAALAQLKADKNVHVYTFTSQQQAKLKKLNQPDWTAIANDPVAGPALKMLQSDVQKYGG